jgi:predicted DsbA family dithiol-disulfide isomerase
VTTLRIDIWSDIACPWCYIGKRHLEAALAGVAHDVEIRWRSFELDPNAPKQPPAQSMVERLAAKYRTTVEVATQRLEHVVSVGARDGLELRFDRMRPGNTFDAHRLLHFAHASGKQDALKERLFRAYMTDGQSVADHAVLAACARDVGLDAGSVLADPERHAADVRADEALARELGITGVPCFVFGGRLAVSGAQPADVLRGALERASLPEAMADGAVCGPDGCT